MQGELLENAVEAYQEQLNEFRERIGIIAEQMDDERDESLNGGA